MKGKRYSEEQIIGALQEVDKGAEVEDVCRRMGVSKVTFYRWKAKFSGMQVSDAKRFLVLSALEGNFLGGSVAVPFLRDVEVHVRFLVAMPLLIGAEILVHGRMRPLGALAQRYVREFDGKWLRGGAPAGEPLLGSRDIQSLSELKTLLRVVF